MTATETKDSSPRSEQTGPYRVMVVDDSAVIRGIFRKSLDTDPEIAVVASVGNGQYAVDTLKREDVEIVVLDIEMPVMDGMTALPLILQHDPSIKVIMASTLTLKNADISLKALELGAADYVSKPTSKSEIHNSDGFNRELIEKVKAMGAARRGRRLTRPAAAKPKSDPSAQKPEKGGSGDAISLRQGSLTVPKLIAIGSSTGGPQALQSLFAGLKGDFKLPILITQHMPPTFTQILAEHITKISQRPCVEAEDGMAVTAGGIYVAPGDFHMTVRGDASNLVLQLDTDPPENFCRPAVDPMLRSLVPIMGDKLLVVILTGMGHDGLDGAEVVVEKGGTVIAQDEESSVVWGMPGAVAMAGLCSAVLPLKELTPEIKRLAGSR